MELSGIGVVPLSDAGITENLSPIDNGSLMRTINGTLIDVTLTSHRKYAVTLSGNDVQPAALGNVWRGQTVTLSAISELAQAATLVSGAVTGVAIDRQPVTGSGRAIYKNGADERFAATVTFTENPTGVYTAGMDFGDGSIAGEAFLLYRPKLSMMVVGFSQDTDEFAGAPGWSLELEEV